MGSDFRTNRKSVCDFLLVHHSNLGPFFAPFREILHVFFVLRSPDPTPIPPYFGGVPVPPDRPCWGQCEQVP